MLPVFDFATPLNWLKEIALSFTKWIALKLLAVTLFTVVLPLAIYAGWKLILKQVMTYVFNLAALDTHASLVQLTGLAAWLADKLRFQECFIVLTSALMARFMMSFFKK